jgi:hypothetical protein
VSSCIGFASDLVPSSTWSFGLLLMSSMRVNDKLLIIICQDCLIKVFRCSIFFFYAIFLHMW